MRRIRLAGRVLAAAALPAIVVAGPSAAHAAVQPADMGFALAETNVAIGLAAVEVAAANVENPNVTCGIPTAHGMNVTPAADVVVATTRGIDVATAQGDCVSRTVMTYTATLVLSVEYRNAAGAWSVISGCVSQATMTAVNGVVVVPTVAECRYEHDDPAAGRPHRAHAVLTNSLSPAPYPNYSEPWQG